VLCQLPNADADGLTGRLCSPSPLDTVEVNGGVMGPKEGSLLTTTNWNVAEKPCRWSTWSLTNSTRAVSPVDRMTGRLEGILLPVLEPHNVARTVASRDVPSRTVMTSCFIAHLSP